MVYTIVGVIHKYTPYAYILPRAVCILWLLRIIFCVYPQYTHFYCLYCLLIYCHVSFPLNCVPYCCVKLWILCCNWRIITTAIILPFFAYHRQSARGRSKTPNSNRQWPQFPRCKEMVVGGDILTLVSKKQAQCDCLDMTRNTFLLAEPPISNLDLTED